MRPPVLGRALLRVWRLGSRRDEIENDLVLHLIRLCIENRETPEP